MQMLARNGLQNNLGGGTGSKWSAGDYGTKHMQFEGLAGLMQPHENILRKNGPSSKNANTQPAKVGK